MIAYKLMRRYKRTGLLHSLTNGPLAYTYGDLPMVASPERPFIAFKDFFTAKAWVEGKKIICPTKAELFIFKVEGEEYKGPPIIRRVLTEKNYIRRGDLCGDWPSSTVFLQTIDSMMRVEGGYTS